MAGMLPGVEAARRRRFHKSSNLSSYGGSEPSPTCTRRSSFCLYASSHEFSSNSSTRNPISQKLLCDDSRLGEAAREAKQRLDQRLQTQRRSQTKRDGFMTLSDEQRSSSPEQGPIAQRYETTQLPKLKKRGMKWLKLRWKSSEQDDCAVCLEQFKAGTETLMQLSCAHKFHTNCLVPWLEAHAHCPCCRMEIPS